ncbi:MAG: C45 family peptidase [Chloroflexota bacterium]
MPKLKRLSVSGSHFDCGQQIGAACGDIMRHWDAETKAHLADGRRWEDYRRVAEPYLAATERAFPWVVEEIRGAAKGAGLDFHDLFTASIEEIFYSPPQTILNAPKGLDAISGSHPEPVGRCSDFAVCAPATEGHVLLAHNNDLRPAAQDQLISIEWRLPDHPRLFTVGIGPYLSIGLNDAKLALTGNELSPNDEKIGIPRLLLARAILSARTFDEAVSIALHTDRASSYNNLISTGDGQIASVEASATDHELLGPEDGWHVHTNHYTHPRMKKYERDAGKLPKSVSRYERARDLMQTCPRPVTLPILKEHLADHNSAPASICRHDEKVKTVFSALIDLTEGTIEAAVGNPCEAEFERVWAA